MAARSGPSRPFQITLTAVLVALIAGLLSIEIAGALADRGRHRGVVTVSACTYSRWIPRSRIYTCAGRFESDARDIRLPYVTFDHDGQLTPGTRVAATVSDRDDTSPKEVGQSWARLAVTGGLSLLLAVVTFLVWWVPRRAGPRGPARR